MPHFPLFIVQHLPRRMALSLCRASAVPESVTTADFPGAVRVKLIARGSTCHVYKIYYPEDGTGVWSGMVVKYGNPLVAKIYASDSHARKTFLTETKIYRYQNKQFLAAPIGDNYINYRVRRDKLRSIPIIVQKWYPCNLSGLIKYIEKGTDHCQESTNDCQLCYSPAIIRRLYLAIAISLMQNLEIFHRMGLLHCDIKPDNILLNYSAADLVAGRGLGPDEPAVNATLCDFGFSRIGSRGNYESPGTVHYSSPEATRGDKHLTAGTDWWSYACTIFELVTGMTLFDVYKSDGTLYDPEMSDSESTVSALNGSSHYSLSTTSDEADARANNRYWDLVKVVEDMGMIPIIYFNAGTNVPDVEMWAKLIKNNLHSRAEERRGFRDYHLLQSRISSL